VALTLLVISPHLDDAVLSVSGLIVENPGAVVATVFAGVPSDPDSSTVWDRACGFGTAEEALTTRRREDAEALGVLGATPLHLGFVDEQYGEQPTRAALRAALRHLIERVRPAAVAYPVGIVNEDHRRVVYAAPAGGAPVHRYAELPYAAGLRLEPPPGWRRMEPGGHRAAKARAAGCYRSQLDLADVSQLHEEAVWRT
jgi:LmbE family N-acetylglucosaminyl deacetylase